MGRLNTSETGVRRRVASGRGSRGRRGAGRAPSACRAPPGRCRARPGGSPRRSPSGSRRAAARPGADRAPNGTMWSSSPCHQRTGTVTSAAVKPQSRVNSTRSVSGAEVWNRLPLSRSSRNIALNSGRASRFRSPGGWTAAYRSSAGPGQRADQPDGTGQGHTQRHPRDGQQRREPHRELDQSPVDGVLAGGRRHPAEDPDAVHPVGHRHAGGQRVGATSGQADQPQRVDPQRVEQDLEVPGPVQDVGVEMRGRRTDARPVDADDAQALLLGVRPRLERDLSPSPRRAVHPHDRGASRRAVLGEAEPPVVAHGHRALERRALDVAHGRSLAAGSPRLSP